MQKIHIEIFGGDAVSHPQLTLNSSGNMLCCMYCYLQFYVNLRFFLSLFQKDLEMPASKKVKT